MKFHKSLCLLLALVLVSVALAEHKPAVGSDKAPASKAGATELAPVGGRSGALAVTSKLDEGGSEDEEGDEDKDKKPQPVKTASKNARLDPANFVVVIIAGLVLFYCAYVALRPPFVDVSKMSASEAAAYNDTMQEIADAGELQWHSAILFVFVASIALMLIFFFMSAMSVLITILFSLIASLALGAALYPYVDHFTGRKFANDVDVPVLGPMPSLVFILAPACAIVVFLWLVTKSWILNNVLAISLIIFFLTSIRLSSLTVATILMVLAFFYDIFWVFCSSSIFGKNVMVTVATGLDVPIKILVSRPNS